MTSSVEPSSSLRVEGSGLTGDGGMDVFFRFGKGKPRY